MCNANEKNHQMMLDGLRWDGMGWYASRIVLDGIHTEKVLDAQDARYDERASKIAREDGLGTPFFLIYPEEIMT